MPILSDDQARVYHALDPYPIHVDELARKLSIQSGKLLSILLGLELNGMVQQLPGKLFSLTDGTTRGVH
ncbi:MAG: hypothetical protein P8X85_15070 [Desulfobacterales bacterium]